MTVFFSMYWQNGGKGAQRRISGIIVWRIRGYGGGLVDMGLQTED